jgi:hypothetical protein
MTWSACAGSKIMPTVPVGTLAAGSPSSARSVLAWLDETGLEDVRLRSLAGKLREPAT